MGKVFSKPGPSVPPAKHVPSELHFDLEAYLDTSLGQSEKTPSDLISDDLDTAVPGKDTNAAFTSIFKALLKTNALLGFFDDGHPVGARCRVMLTALSYVCGIAAQRVMKNASDMAVGVNSSPPKKKLEERKINNIVMTTFLASENLTHFTQDRNVITDSVLVRQFGVVAKTEGTTYDENLRSLRNAFYKLGRETAKRANKFYRNGPFTINVTPPPGMSTNRASSTDYSTVLNELIEVLKNYLSDYYKYLGDGKNFNTALLKKLLSPENRANEIERLIRFFRSSKEEEVNLFVYLPAIFVTEEYIVKWFSSPEINAPPSFETGELTTHLALKAGVSPLAAFELAIAKRIGFLTLDIDLNQIEMK